MSTYDRPSKYRIELTTTLSARLPEVGGTPNWDEFCARLRDAGYAPELAGRWAARQPDPPFAPGAGGQNTLIGTLSLTRATDIHPAGLVVGNIRYGS